MRIVALSGSLQARSANLELVQTAAASAPAGVEVVVFDGLGICLTTIPIWKQPSRPQRFTRGDAPWPRATEFSSLRPNTGTASLARRRTASTG